MSWMNRRRILALIATVAVAVAPSASQAAVLLYQQVFNPPPPDVAIGPWSFNAIGGFNGTYSGAFAAGPPPGLLDAATNTPIGRTGPADTAGTAAYTGIGGAVTGDLRAFYTVEGQAGYAAIDPTLYPNLNFNIWANLQGGGADDFGTFVFEGQTGGPRGPKQWYASTTPMTAPTASGALFDLRSLLYDPAAGNWNLLTLDPTNVVAPNCRWSSGRHPGRHAINRSRGSSLGDQSCW